MSNYQVTLDAFETSNYKKIVDYHGVEYEFVPQVFNDLVMKPILKGDAASTIDPSLNPYSIVQFPDVSAPAMIANQLSQISSIAFNVKGAVRQEQETSQKLRSKN